MVQIIDPRIGETVYDPACGTGGFIVRAFEYVHAHIERRRVSGVERERLLRELKERHLVAVEHVPLVFKLPLMNMILHGDGSAQLHNDDSLSNKAQDVHKGRYDIILANPPFGATKQERTAQFEYHIRLYEALFIQHMMNALRPGGRAAVVVKEGLLFDSKGMLRKICRRLVEEFELLAVLSLTRAIGVSNFTADMIEECLQYGPVHCSQPKFSLLTRHNLEGLIPYCHERDIASIVYSSLEQGVLTGKVTPDRKFAEGDKRVKQVWFQPRNLEKALVAIQGTVQPIAGRHNATPAQVALAWTISQPGITCALAGARTAQQAQENADAMTVRLPDEERDEILAAFEALGEPA